ncbi:type II toxin-antitoxin system VapC family toxin [soil metagenome]
MILCDSNVWLALALSGHVHHLPARAWLDAVDEPAAINFCRATQQSFLRLLTSTAVFAPYGNRALTNMQAWAAYQALLGDERIDFQEGEPPELEPLWIKFAGRDSASPKMWMDAYLAAFAVGGGFTFVSTDRAFEQFAGLDLLILS